MNQSESETPQTVQRWCIIIRDAKGKGELWGRLFSTSEEAVAEARFWGALRQSNEAPELVTISVPTHGVPVMGDARDVIAAASAGIRNVEDTIPSPLASAVPDSDLQPAFHADLGNPWQDEVNG